MDNNIPAFPRAGFSSPIHVADVGEPGMTLLDYFAAKAMQGHRANDHFRGFTPEEYYRVALAMLEERKKYINNGTE